MSETTAQISEAAGDPVPALAGMAAAPIVVRPPPGVASTGPIGWARKNLFGSITSTIVTLVLAYLLGSWAFRFINWGIIHAVWYVPDLGNATDTGACRAVQGVGACWAVVTDNYRVMLFGRFPYDEQWRPAIVVLLFIGLYIVSGTRRFWRKELLLVWVATLAVIGLLMWGGVLGLAYVQTDSWGGLPLTLILATFGLAFAFPLSVLVALGRRSTGMPAVKYLCVVYVELIRGVPLITLAVHGERDVPAVHAGGYQSRQAAARAGRRSSCSPRRIWPKSCAAGCSPCRVVSMKRPTRSA